MNMRLRMSLMIAAVAIYAVMSHGLMTRMPNSVLTLAVVLGPMALAALTSLWQLGRRASAAVVGCAVATGLIALTQGRFSVPSQWLYLGQHAGIHAALAIGFGSTLRQTAVPLITLLASRMHALSANMQRYTRRVTLAWVAYFAAVCAVSLVLYACAPFAWWSLFANIGTPLSLAAMFIGEHAIRYKLHPEFTRTDLMSAVRAYRQHHSHSAVAELHS